MTSESSNTKMVAALGRPFTLGKLYDCRQDSLIPSMTLWNRDDLASQTIEKPQSYNNFNIVASESISEKSSALNLEVSLKASFLFGLVHVSGSAKYLHDNKKSKMQARVTLKYEASTKFQELSMDHLGRGKLKYPEVFDKGIATHVVTGILYGAQAFFVFDCEVSEDESHQEFENNFKGILKKVSNMIIKGNSYPDLDSNDKKLVDKFSCKFHGDISPKKSPTTFQEALDVYHNMPKLLGANEENAVPIKVWLLPLTRLDSSAAKLVRQINAAVVEEAQSLLEDFHDLEMRTNDALRTTAQQFPQIYKKLEAFRKMCSEFKLGFQQSFAKKLPSVRGRGLYESMLAEIPRKRHSSPFNNKNLNEWMDSKEREIYTLKSFTTMLKSTKIVPSQTDVNREILSVEHAVFFVFTSLGRPEPYLSALSDYLKGTTKSDDLQDAEKEPWCDSEEVLKEIRNKVKLFRDFAEANKKNKNIKFLTVGLTNQTQKGSIIYLYKNGFPVSENFEPPSKPETVTVSDINHNSVTLKISPPRFGSENISSYSVEYCVSGEDGWQQHVASSPEEVTVSDLRPNTEYMFRCRAVTSAGVGPASEVVLAVPGS